MLRKGFGDYLRKLRGKRTLREVAKLTGLSHTYIRDLELGVNRKTNKPSVPSYPTILKLSEAYHVGVNDIWRQMYDDLTDDDLFIELLPEDTEEEKKEKEKSLRLWNDIQKEEVLSKKDLTRILQQSNITYNYHSLNDEDRQRILDMLKVLFPDRK